LVSLMEGFMKCTVEIASGRMIYTRTYTY
jgi:hypothetical protein